MADTPNLPPSIMSHVSVGTNDYERAKAFYTAVLATLEIKVMMEHPGAVAFGRAFPEFWVGVPHDGGRAVVGNGSHFGFLAVSRAQVDAFYAKALEMGGQGDGAPGPRDLYGPQYYGAFVRDLDGHKIEAMFWDEAAGGSAG
ncbi:putative lactoylglutathione lyase [Polaromonas sp. CF318]|uniref:VOC family protein n=1 Tax=Polaromonas sp. CF318 TaxID=1144318 RepID=UPI00027100B6|nr:VOC family protein [Polaromonas sp. CF318]EJL90963.1 putative lactoylglutathione lyase [Polaromonas sp. CF318]